MNTGSDPQLAALAWIVLVGLAAVVAAVVALIRSGRSVPLARFPRRRPR